MIAAEKLLRYLARLSIQGTQLPDKPPTKRSSRSKKGAKRLKVKNSLGGRLSPARCGHSPTQSVSGPRRDTTSALDVAASLVYITDLPTRRLVEWLATPWWRNEDALALCTTLCTETKRRFPNAKPMQTRAQAEALVVSVLNELKGTDACQRCSTNGLTYDQKAQKWAHCPTCDGLGYLNHGYRRRMEAVQASLPPSHPRITDHQFRHHWAEPYQWLVDHCHQQIAQAWADIKDKR